MTTEQIIKFIEEELCPKLEDLGLSSAGLCDGGLYLSAPDPDRARDGLAGILGAAASWIPIQEEKFCFFGGPNTEELERRKRLFAESGPIRPGDTVGPNSEMYIGTVGCFVKKGDEHLAITAGHAVPDSGSLFAAYTKVSTKAISKLDDLPDDPIDFGVAKICDCIDRVAISISPNSDCDSGVIFSGNGVVQADDWVAKCGAKTGATDGRILCPDLACVMVEDEDGRTRKFRHQIVVDNMPGPGKVFADNGDSGSVMFKQVNGRVLAVGLIFAKSQSGKYILATPMDRILSRLQGFDYLLASTTLQCDCQDTPAVLETRGGKVGCR